MGAAAKAASYAVNATSATRPNTDSAATCSQYSITAMATTINRTNLKLCAGKSTNAMAATTAAFPLAAAAFGQYAVATAVSTTNTTAVSGTYASTKIKSRKFPWSC